MSLDIRIPIGLMFSIFGVILTVYGVITNGDAQMYARSLGINANLGWGLVLLAFGAMMLLLAHRAKKKTPKKPE